MHNILFFLTVPTNNVETLKSIFPTIFSQSKENNNIFSELLLLFNESQSEEIIERKLIDLGIDVFLCECLF